MQFTFCDCNHSNQGHDTLEDPKRAIAGMLMDLGHNVTFFDKYLEGPPAYTLMFEGFGKDSILWMQEMKRIYGVRFIIICTERFGKESLNDTPHKEMVNRQKWLPLAAAEAYACWCLVPGMADKLKPFCENSHDIELGYSEIRAKVLRDDREPKAEFCFYGGQAGRRGEVIKIFRQRGASVVTPREYLSPEQLSALMEKVKEQGLVYNDYAPQCIRNAVCADAKVTLGLRPFDPWHIASSSRFQLSLHIGRPVVVEEIDDSDKRSPWRDVVPFVPTEDIFLAAKEMAGNWVKWRDVQLSRFKHYLSPEKAIGHALAAVA